MNRPDLRLVASNGERLDVGLPPGHVEPSDRPMARFVMHLTVAPGSYNAWQQFQENMRGEIFAEPEVSRDPIEDIDRGFPSQRLVIADESALTQLGHQNLLAKVPSQHLVETLRESFRTSTRGIRERPAGSFVMPLDEDTAAWGVHFGGRATWRISDSAHETLEHMSETRLLLTVPHLLLGTIHGEQQTAIAAVVKAFGLMTQRRKVPRLSFDSPDVTSV